MHNISNSWFSTQLKNKLPERLSITILFIFIISLLIILSEKSAILFTSGIHSDIMMPSFHPGERIWATSLIKPKYNSVICYKSFFNYSDNHKENISVSRLIGLEGDTIEINDGYLLRNGIIADIPEKLTFTLYAKKSHIYNFKMLDNLSIRPIINEDSVILSLNYYEYKKFSYNILLHKINTPYKLKQLHNKGNKNEECRSECDIQIVIPKGYCFVMGDNRGREYYPLNRGLVPLVNIIATVIF